MSWLNPPGDAVEATVRRALAAGAGRTGDEVARRRVWTRIAEPPSGPVRSRLWLLRVGLALMVVAGAAGALMVWPAHEAGLPFAPAGDGVVTSSPGAAAVEAPAVPARQALRGPSAVRTRAGERLRVVLGGGAEADLEPNTSVSVDEGEQARIDQGRVTLVVARQAHGQRFSVAAGAYLIEVIGTRFHVRVVGDSVGVDVEEGLVEVWRDDRAVRLRAGEFWTSPSLAEPRRPASRTAVRPARRLATARGHGSDLRAARSTASSWQRADAAGVPPPAPAEATAGAGMGVRSTVAIAAVAAPAPPLSAAASAAERFRNAQAALADGRPQRALKIFESLAAGQGAAAENAAYEIGRVYREHLLGPRHAIAAWQRYRVRFPRGLLRVETDLSILETLLAQGDTSAALTEAEAFVERHPDSERRAEIAHLAERLRATRR